MKSFQLIRLNVSSYQSPEFIEREKETLQSPELRYCRSQDDLDSSPLILLTNTHTRLSEIKNLLTRTKLIIHPNSGYDNLSQDYSLIQNIPTIIGHEIRAHAVADWILSCFFEASVKRPKTQNWDPSRQWNRTLLKGKEVVLFGYGHIGKIVTASLKALGVIVHVVDPYIDGFIKDYRELPKKSYHALILCCGLNEKNKQFFNKELFNHLSSNLIFNSARGGLINEKDLKDYLTQTPEAQAYLDVFSKEPYQDEWNHFPQVIRSSHIAGVYADLDQEIINFEHRVLKDYLQLDEENFTEKYFFQLLSSKIKEGVII